jgi:Abnormal spindle-like microcephaly-assoc'd, ASPM-SPD-2-Hydin/PQQ-like domain
MRLAACLAALTLTLSAATASVAIASQQHESQLKQRPPQAQPADEDTASQNLLRDDWDPSEPGLSPATLQGGQFGQLFATHVDGQVYAQPLVVDDPGTATTAPGSSVIVATENNTVYSIDGTTGQVIWSNHLGTPWSYTVSHCADLTPDIGITSTPVYNPATHLLYVVADIAGSSSTNPHPAYYVYALSEQTGAVEWRTAVHGPPTNAKAENFAASEERQRTGLLLMNGWLYFGFASFCDYGSYTGFVSGVNITSRAQTMWTDETGSAGNQSGIWMSGGGLMSDGSGRIFLATGNGVSPPPGPGNRPPGELGDSVVRLSQNTSTGALTASDFFSPANAPTLDREDGDLGAGGTVGLPFGTSTYPHLMVQAGKDHRVFLLNRDSLGGRETGRGGSDNPVFTGGPYGGQWGHPAAYAGGGGSDYVYYSGSGEGSSDYLRVLRFNGHFAALPQLLDVANSPGTFGFTSGSPVVTSKGDVNSSAIVWEVYASGPSGAGGRLEAFNAVPAAGHATLTELWSAPIGTAAKFSVPATDGGHVYVGTRSDTVYGFGVSNALPLVSGQVSFGSVGVGGAAETLPATVTADRTMEVTGLSISSTASPVPFALGKLEVGGKAVTTFPVTITAGQQLTVPITFTPTTADAVTGSLAITTNVPGYPTVNIPLTGTGSTAGLSAYPTSLPFGTTVNIPDSLFNGPVPTGGTQTFEVNITNTSTRPETIATIRPPAAPFSISGLNTGTVLLAGEAVVVAVTYAPTRATSSDSNSFTIGDSTGQTVTVPLTGISAHGTGVLVSSQSQVQFGAVPVGTSVTDIVRIVNTGNLPVTVSVFLTPGRPFSTPVPLAKGLAISPDDIVTLPVQLTPQARGSVSAAYSIAATYGNGKVVRLALRVSGKGV